MDPAAKWLESHGAEFREQRVNLSQVDKDRSLKNQARVSAPLNEDVVLLYAVAMEGGEEFPPIITYKNGTDKHIVVDGNHRLAAAEVISKASLQALVITNATPAMIQALTYEANTKHGLPTTINERVQQALHLEASGMTRADAAKLMGVPVNRLADAALLARTDVRIFKIRHAVGDIPIAIRKRLDNIRNDNVLKAALELITTSKLSSTEVNDLVSKINRSSTEADQMLEIQRETGRQATKIAATAGGKINLPIAITELNRAMAAVDRLDPEAISKAWPQIGEALKMVYMAKVLDAKRRITEIING